MDELKKIIDEKKNKYCGSHVRCKMSVNVGYFEGGAGTFQAFLEPVMVFSIVQRSDGEDGGEVAGRHFTIPIRDKSVAENIAPEDLPDPVNQ